MVPEGDGWKATDSQTTRAQADAVVSLPCTLVYEGELLPWTTFDDPDEPNTIFQSIVRDRYRRVDENFPMVNKPPFAVVTVERGRAVRLEYYAGYKHLVLIFDIRSYDWHDKNIPPFIKGDLW
jgi:hypothetical protein